MPPLAGLRKTMGKKDSGEIPRRLLGHTGVRVSALALGGYHLGAVKTKREAIRIVHEAVDAGLTFMDNAWEYHEGYSEELMGEALAGRREKVFLMTKVCTHGRDKKAALRQLEQSLRRLKTDHLDLYYLHRLDPDVPVDEPLRALDDLVRAGKVRYIGASTTAAWQFVEALWVSKELHLNRFVAETPPYNILDRRIERELLPSNNDR